jgi:hypothetical protein
MPTLSLPSGDDRRDLGNRGGVEAREVVCEPMSTEGENERSEEGGSTAIEDGPARLLCGRVLIVLTRTSLYSGPKLAVLQLICGSNVFSHENPKTSWSSSRFARKKRQICVCALVDMSRSTKCVPAPAWTVPSTLYMGRGFRTLRAPSPCARAKPASIRLFVAPESTSAFA